jgi:hypothetical protein
VEPVKGGVLSPSETATGHDHLINDLDDVETAGAEPGDGLVFTGDGWVPGAVASSDVANEIEVRTDQPADTVELWVDTDEVYPVGWALGKVAIAIWAPTPDPATAFTTVIDIPTLSCTWTADPTRLYKITVSGNTTQITAAGDQTLILADAANAGIAQFNASPQLNRWWAWTVVFYASGLSGSITRKMRISSNAASGSLRAQPALPWTMCVEDIGPA